MITCDSCARPFKKGLGCHSVHVLFLGYEGATMLNPTFAIDLCLPCMKEFGLALEGVIKKKVESPIKGGIRRKEVKDDMVQQVS